MSEFLTNPCFRRVMPPSKTKPWELHEDLKYRSTLLGFVLTVPAGYRTDFASVPWLFRRIFPQDGPWTLAAVVHDWLCTQKTADIDSAISADVMNEAMELLGVPSWKRKAIHKAVRWFGPRWP